MSKKKATDDLLSSVRAALSYQKFKPARSNSLGEMLRLRVAFGALTAIAKEVVNFFSDL